MIFPFSVSVLHELLTAVQNNGHVDYGHDSRIFLVFLRTTCFMIVSKRIKIRRGKVGSEQLLEHILKYFKDTLNGDVLRFAIIGASGATLVADVSIRVEDVAQKTKKDGGKRAHG